MDMAGKTHWDGLWSGKALPPAWDPDGRGFGQYLARRFDEYFSRLFLPLRPTAGKTLLEIGCAGSASLPYFARHFGFSVTGIDYSETGCQQARAVLERERVRGQVVCADLFSPSDSLLGRFDVVVSFGVVSILRHRGCIASGEFLAGQVICRIPNMTGANGRLQMLLNRRLFDMHVPLDREMLAGSHRAAGLTVVSCDYFLSTGFGVCSLTGLEEYTASWWAKKIALALLARVSLAVWSIESLTGNWKAGKRMSPYINCAAYKV
jgi:hypothetical protein